MSDMMLPSSSSSEEDVLIRDDISDKSDTIDSNEQASSSVVGTVDVDYVCPKWLTRKLLERQSGLLSDRKPLIVLDCRSTESYSNAHIKDSVHISLPKILHKRLLKGSLQVWNVISPTERRESVAKMAQENAHVVLVGLSQPQPDDDSVLSTLSPSPTTMTSSSPTRSSSSAGGQMCNDVPRLIYAQLVKDGYTVSALRGSVDRFLCEHPQFVAHDDQSPTNSSDKLNRPTQIGPLLTLDRLSIEDQSSCDSCYSSPEESNEISNSATVPGTSAGSCINNNNNDDSDPIYEKIMSFSMKKNMFPVEILPGLYLGNAQNASDRKTLERYHINYILNVTPNLPNTFEQDDDYKYLQIPIDDHWSQNLATHFPRAIEFIDEARNNGSAVLVHCLAGISRSVTVTVAYLMQTLNMTLDGAYDLVKAQKSNIAPNFNFMGQLLDFERQLRGDSGSPDSGQFCYDESAVKEHSQLQSQVNEIRNDDDGAKAMHFLSPKTAVSLRRAGNPGSKRSNAVHKLPCS